MIRGCIWSLLTDQKLCGITNGISRLMVAPGFVNSNLYTIPGPFPFLGLGTVGGLPMLGQRVGLGLRGEEVVVLTPLSIDGEFGEAVSECERLKTSSSRRSARFFLIWVKTGARRGETVKVVGWWM